MRRPAALAALAAAALLAAASPRDAGRPAVELLLVLAVDCSQSVDAAEYRLQLDGIADALRQPSILAAVEASRTGIAITLMQWSGARSQVQAIPWSRIADAASAEDFARQVEATARLADGDATAIGAALTAAQRLIEIAPYAARRRIIDVSGDGMNNQGEWPDFVKPRLVAAGTIVNGLAILNEEQSLADYYRIHVIAGPGAFVLRADDYASFAEAMSRKLLLEITGLQVPAGASAAPRGFTSREFTSG